MESNPGASSCGQAAGQSPSRLPGLFVAMLEELRNLGDHRRDFWEGRGGESWQVTANFFGGTVNVMREPGCGSVSHHWNTFWGRLQGEVLGALKSEAQQKPWRVRLACKQLLFPGMLPAFRPRSTEPCLVVQPLWDTLI